MHSKGNNDQSEEKAYRIEQNFSMYTPYRGIIPTMYKLYGIL